MINMKASTRSEMPMNMKWWSKASTFFVIKKTENIASVTHRIMMTILRNGCLRML